MDLWLHKKKQMKIRNGFVSNSSASSFTIYGWSEDSLSANIAKLSPAFAGVAITIDEDVFEQNLEEIWTGDSWDIVSKHDPDGIKIIGIGQSGCEIDHYLPPGQDWEDFEYPEPTDKKKKEFDKIAKQLNLPKPKLYKRTWFDG
jgi:hypothetical protein